MPYSLKIDLEGLPKTVNAIGRKHWAVKAKDIQTWKMDVLVATMGLRPEKPLKRAHVRLTRFSSTCPDFDGLVSSFKCVLDALIDAKILEDDSYDHIGAPEYSWEKAPRGKGHVCVEVFESPLPKITHL